jgi:ATP-dependent helicase/nuclease subunit B
MVLRPTLLLVPSWAAALEWPRRLAATGRAVAGLLPFRLGDLARAVAEPSLLGRGRRAWDSGLSALLAARHLDEVPSLRLDVSLPRGPVAAALARTLGELRARGLPPETLEKFARSGNRTLEDADRLQALATLYRHFDADIEDFLDPTTLYREATLRLAETPWLLRTEALLVESLDVHGHERLFLDAVCRTVPTRTLDWTRGDGLRDTIFAALEPKARPPSLARVAEGLFEVSSSRGPSDTSVEFFTASSEAAEVRSIGRRVLRAAAAGMPFEEMGVLLPRPEEYAPLFADLFGRLEIPYRLHPSLPLRFGRAARSLLLLFRCRGLERAAVMEFLTFVPPGAALADGAGRAAQWDYVSRDAAIVSGRERFAMGLARYAEEQRREAADLADEPSRRRREGRAQDADALGRVVERLALTLERLDGNTSWSDWSKRLLGVLDEWVGEEHDRETVREVLQDLGSLEFASARARWEEVERVLEARFEWERMPLIPATGGAVHIGVFDALAGVPFRLVAIPGLVEGGFPGVIRPDPFLLDAERESIGAPSASASRPGGRTDKKQLALFEEEQALAGPIDPLPTTQHRLLDARRRFRRAVNQATECLFLSYPRADPRTGRERMPSLFFVAAASAREGRALSSTDLDSLVVEDDLDQLGLLDTLDASERDRARMRKGGEGAQAAIAAGCAHFARSRSAANRRWSHELTIWDGLVNPLPADLGLKLDPTTAPSPISASRLATFAQCGFRYMLQYVLRLQATPEPEERLAISPIERGDLFHRVAETFLRSLRDEGQLPVKNDEGTRRRLRALSEGALDRLAAKSPPRFTALWERECNAFHGLMTQWLRREADPRYNTTPIHLEVGFGPSVSPTPGEPHLPEPIAIDLKDGRVLRVSGKIDRIDRAHDGTLVLRDYKTGKAPRDDGRVFRGGAQLQIPFYILAAAKLFPGERVSRAFLDYVNGGRDVALDVDAVRGESFPALLRGLVETIGAGVFLQEPTACTFCDFKSVCGPQPHLELKRLYKREDHRVKRALALRDVR